jgi:hypothetical protein
LLLQGFPKPILHFPTSLFLLHPNPYAFNFPAAKGVFRPLEFAATIASSLVVNTFLFFILVLFVLMLMMCSSIA